MADPERRPGGRRAIRFAGVAGVVLLVLVAVSAAVALLSARPGDRALHPARDGEATVTVYVIRNWLHASLAVPAAELRRASGAGPAAMALERLPESEWVLLGWGDAMHFRGRGDSPARRRSLARSLLVPDNPAVILMDAEDRRPSPATTGRRVVELTLSRRGFERLTARLDASFSLDPAGGPRVAGRGRDLDSLFFHSIETADLAHACNHWIADLLDAAGVPTTPFVDTVSAGLAWDLKLRAGARDVPGRPGPERRPDHETPPAHSGRFDPLSESARTTGPAVFESYAVSLDGVALDTVAVRLARASEPSAPGGPPWSQVLDVSPAGLVELRRIRAPDPAHGLCGDRPATGLALGFRVDDDERYRIAMAALAGAELCDVFQYIQP